MFKVSPNRQHVRGSIQNIVGLLTIVGLLVVLATSNAMAAPPPATSGCQLVSPKDGIQHVIYIQFDNVHLRRDNPNVPSDLEQMPHLLNFLENNGTVLNKHYTILISHTAGGILSSLTGLNPDRMGITVSNSYDYYKPDTTPTFTSAFKYWTSPVSTTDTLPNMVNGDSGTPKTTPAPWVSYTRAGCDVGNVSVANTVLENNSVAPGGDIYNVYGVPSPEASEPAALRTTDFVGIAVHCASTSTSVCNNSAHAKSDPLPDEPGGYNGYSALFGAKYVDPAITGGSAAVNDINGQPIKDSAGNPGFPGFDGMTAANTLGYVAQMQEAGIPVTFAYISDVHDNHAGFGAYGPGEAGYVTALKSYDDAFGKFIDRLASDGINKSNTLFVVTADENDHYAGQQAQSCDGVNTPCTYNTTPGLATNGTPAHGIFDVTNGGTMPFTAPSWPPAGVNGPLVGEVGYNLKWLLGSTIAGTGYDISFDSAPSFYINGQPQAVDAAGNVVLNPTLRAFEQAAANLKAFDPYIDSTQLTPVAKYLVDAPTLKAIHMFNADQQRTMTFTMFSQPDYYFQTFSPCPSPSQGCVNDGFAWIHGDYSNDIGQTWLGLAGPGVKSGGIEDTTWTDHTDIVPTMMHLLGLSTDYQPDGRVITQVLTPSVAKGANGASFTELGDVYKQLNAPYGAFAHSLIVASTNGIKADDPTYLETERAIQSLTLQRDALVQQMKDVLDGSANGHREQLVREGRNLLEAAQALAGL
jgi:hypothetical protein